MEVVSFHASMPTDPEPPFARLVRGHQVAVWRYLRFLGCAPAEADDLTQETFVRVLDKSVQRFGDDGARAYLRRVAKNAFLKHVERKGRAPEIELDAAEAAFEWYRRDDDGESTRAALDACLEELSAEARLALSLRFAEQLDRRSIAARLGIGEHGAKSLLQRTYARLRTCIERRLSHD